MTQRRVGQTHPIAPNTVALVKTRTPTKLQGVPECLRVHTSTVIGDDNVLVGDALFIGRVENHENFAGICFKCVVYEFGQSGSQTLVTRVPDGLDELGWQNQRVSIV